MEKRKKTKIRKWDEVQGIQETEVEEGALVTEEGADETRPLSREVMRALEDLLEQNDNSLDGVINNLPPSDENANARLALQEEEERKRKSVLKRLGENSDGRRLGPGCGICPKLERA